MTLVQAIVLGVVQGLTEFLPVSSTAHLVITQHLFGLEGYVLLVFDIVVHVGTLLAIFIYFARDLFPLSRIGVRLFWLIVIATIPTAMLGFAMRGWMRESFDALWLTSVTLLINSFILWSTKWVPKQAKKKIESWLDALWVGIAQGISVLPGISRSGATVTTALWLKIEPEEAVRFSFFVGVPAILGASLFILPEGLSHLSADMWPAMIAGFISSFVAGYMAIYLLFQVVRRGKFHDFAFYTLVLAIVSFFFSR